MGTHFGTVRKDLSGKELGFDSFFQENGYTRAPLLVQWMATARCALACPHCLSASSGSSKELDLREVEGFLDQVAGLGVYELLLTGGEPLLRPDLSGVIRLLEERKIRWSLNTARGPSPEVEKAMEHWPPSFVAVSIDGPEEYHDAFRGRSGAFEEALRAVRLFKEMTRGDVACGTTVTRRNLSLLDETLRIVMGSGADLWGLHLVFPEGNASGKPELMLSRKELGRLIQYAADRRVHFPVTLGDELGYCGQWEPLLRDEPFFCAAGRAQCVVLPDGHVVPCTTFDTSTSAGSIRQQSLAEIWRQGFGELRKGLLTAECRECRYAPACGGGCWLQRRHGVHCYRSVWSKEGFVKKAAGIAVCLGLAACSGPSRDGSPEGRGTVSRPPAAPATRRVEAPRPAAEPAPARAPAPRATAAKVEPKPAAAILVNGMDGLEMSIMEWYRANAGQFPEPAVQKAKKRLQKILGHDPAGKFLLSFMSSKRPVALKDRSEGIEKALATPQRSLSLISFLVRDLAEWCLDSKKPQDRDPSERKLVRETLKAISSTMETWRKDVLDKRLEPFVQRSRYAFRPFVVSKAGFRRPRFVDPLLKQIGHKRWGASLGTQAISDAYLRAHPYALSMRLSFRVAAGSGLVKVTPGKTTGKTTTLKKKGWIDVFDLLSVPRKGRKIRLVFGSGRYTLNVALPSGAELTWADLLRLAYEQNKARIASFAARPPSPLLPQPFLLPFFRARLFSMEASRQSDVELPRLRWHVISMWMF